MSVTLHQLLKTMVERGGSDLHVTTNSPPQIRIDGKLVPLDMPPLSAPETKQIPYEILGFKELGLPPVVEEICGKPRGLVLVTGPTGSGKSTTLAAMIDKINRERH